jgi:hypothetical protein
MKNQGIILIWVLVIAALLSSIVLFGLESLNRLETVVHLEKQRVENRREIEQKIQEQWHSLQEHCAEWPGEHSVRLIGFAPNTTQLGEKNGRYFYEISFDAMQGVPWQMVVVTRFPLMDLLSEGRFVCR